VHSHKIIEEKYRALAEPLFLWLRAACMTVSYNPEQCCTNSMSIGWEKGRKGRRREGNGMEEKCIKVHATLVFEKMALQLLVVVRGRTAELVKYGYQLVQEEFDIMLGIL
jgi:hypothetical protein